MVKPKLPIPKTDRPEVIKLIWFQNLDGLRALDPLKFSEGYSHKETYIDYAIRNERNKAALLMLQDENIFQALGYDQAPLDDLLYAELDKREVEINVSIVKALITRGASIHTRYNGDGNHDTLFESLCRYGYLSVLQEIMTILPIETMERINQEELAAIYLSSKDFNAEVAGLLVQYGVNFVLHLGGQVEPGCLGEECGLLDTHV